MDVCVLNWKKFNSEGSTRKKAWFKCDAFMVDSPNFADFTAPEFKVWIYILSMCARQNSGELRINLSHVCRISALRWNNFVSAVRKLESIQALNVKNDKFPNLTSANPVRKRGKKEATTEEPKTTAPAFLPELERVSATLIERGVSLDAQNAWLAAFPEPEWVIGEIRKALSWETADPRRKKKIFSRFMNNWLTKAWDMRRLEPSGRPNYALKRESDNRAAADEYLKTFMGGES